MMYFIDYLLVVTFTGFMIYCVCVFFLFYISFTQHAIVCAPACEVVLCVSSITVSCV